MRPLKELYGTRPGQPTLAAYTYGYQSPDRELVIDDRAKTVLRSGYGIFFSRQNLFSGPVELIRNGPGIPTAVSFSRAELTQYGLNFPDGSAKALAFLKVAPLDTDLTIDPNWKNPYSQQ